MLMTPKNCPKSFLTVERWSGRRTVLLYMSRTRLVSLPLGSKLEHGSVFPESSITLRKSRFRCYIIRIGRFGRFFFGLATIPFLCCEKLAQFCFSKLNWCCSIFEWKVRCVSLFLWFSISCTRRCRYQHGMGWVYIPCKGCYFESWFWVTR